MGDKKPKRRTYMLDCVMPPSNIYIYIYIYIYIFFCKNSMYQYLFCNEILLKLTVLQVPLLICLTDTDTILILGDDVMSICSHI